MASATANRGAFSEAGLITVTHDDSGNAILVGNAVVLSSTTDPRKVKRGTANNAYIVGVAVEKSPGDTKEFKVCNSGYCIGLAGGTINAGKVVVSDANGALVQYTASGSVASNQDVYAVGVAMQDAVSGDYFTVFVNPYAALLA